MKRTGPRSALLLALFALASPGVASALTSSAANWSTDGGAVVCGTVAGVRGTQFDPGTASELDGLWPGLQCSARGIPRPRQGIGDPFVQLGQGHAGRARLVDESQDGLQSAAPSVTLRPGSVWKRDHIDCAVRASSIRCSNDAGHGFKMSPGHVQLF
jgi:hypothetical protein